jgi:hypothetical protein
MEILSSSLGQNQARFPVDRQYKLDLAEELHGEDCLKIKSLPLKSTDKGSPKDDSETNRLRRERKNQISLRDGAAGQNSNKLAPSVEALKPSLETKGRGKSPGRVGKPRSTGFIERILTHGYHNKASKGLSQVSSVLKEASPKRRDRLTRKGTRTNSNARPGRASGTRLKE